MKDDEQDRFDRAVADHQGLTAAMQRGVREALIRHKKLGEPITDWRDGQVVWIPAEEIVVDEDGDEPI